MNSYKVFMASLLFFALFTGASNFQQSFFEGQSVQNDNPVGLDNEYESLKNKTDTMRQRIRTISQPDTGVLQDVAAGLYLVPDFIGLLLAPITILGSTLDAIGAAYFFVPSFATTALKYMIYIGLAYSAFRLLIGLRG